MHSKLSFLNPLLHSFWNQNQIDDDGKHPWIYLCPHVFPNSNIISHYMMSSINTLIKLWASQTSFEGVRNEEETSIILPTFVLKEESASSNILIQCSGCVEEK